MTTDEAMKKLCEETGLEEIELIEESILDSVAHAICVKCGYTTMMEPDQDAGYCELCEQNTVKSCLVLRGTI